MHLIGSSSHNSRPCLDFKQKPVIRHEVSHSVGLDNHSMPPIAHNQQQLRLEDERQQDLKQQESSQGADSYQQSSRRSVCNRCR